MRMRNKSGMNKVMRCNTRVANWQPLLKQATREKLIISLIIMAQVLLLRTRNTNRQNKVTDLDFSKDPLKEQLSNQTDLVQFHFGKHISQRVCIWDISDDSLYGCCAIIIGCSVSDPEYLFIRKATREHPSPGFHEGILHHIHCQYLDILHQEPTQLSSVSCMYISISVFILYQLLINTMYLLLCKFLT